MNESLLLLLVTEIIFISTCTEAIPGWWWNAEPKSRGWNGHNYACRTGECVKVWQCPQTAIYEDSTGSCSYWSNGLWVCCDIHQMDDKNIPEITTIYSTESTNIHVKDTFIRNSRNHRVKTSTANYHSEDGFPQAATTKGVWHRSERPSNIRPLSGILKNSWETYPRRTSWNKTTKIPVVGISKETVINNKFTTTKDDGRTTNSWYKPHSSVPQVLYPSERYSTQKVMRYTTLRPQTKRTTNSYSTKKTLIRSTSATTKAPWGYTRYPGRTVSRTTTHPYVMKSTAPTRVTSMPRNRNGSWEILTTARPATSRTKRPNTKKPSFTPSTRRTTRRFKVTTPLPNINTHLCGIREERRTRRQRRYTRYEEHNPILDVDHSGATYQRTGQPFLRIVGGKEAEPFSWPWVAALYKVTPSGGNRFLSAGSLINCNFVLTAAHVFTPDDLRTASYVAMLGTHDAQDAVAEYTVSSVLLHPKYEHRFYYNDIALLKLERPVVFNDYVMPVCLPSPNAPLLRDRDLQGKNVTVMGWGDESFGGKSSRVLREATFPIVSRTSCNASYVRVASNRFPKGITQNMLCAGDPNGGKDACQGDSGGPLTVIENGRYTQVGIVSFGYQCGDKEFPGVYTKVAPYLSWIAENTKPDEDYLYHEY